MHKSKKEIQFEQPSDILLSANRFIIPIMAVVVLAILIVGYFFILKPKINSISSVQLASTATEERKVKNELLLTKLKELEAEYNDIMDNRQEDLDSLKKMVPQGSQVAELFLMADKLAKDQDFQLLSIDISDSSSDQKTVSNTKNENDITPEGVAPVNTDITNTTADLNLANVDDVLAASGIKSMVVHLSISKNVGEDDDTLGSEIYSDLKNYVAELENNIRLLDVQAIDFLPIAAEGEANYIFNLDLITYYQ